MKKLKLLLKYSPFNPEHKDARDKCDIFYYMFPTKREQRLIRTIQKYYEQAIKKIEWGLNARQDKEVKL